MLIFRYKTVEKHKNMFYNVKVPFKIGDITKGGLMEDLITLNEFAKLLNKPVSTIRTWKRRGNLPSYIFRTIGSTIFIKISLFEDWIK